jgi:hypothetical protein
VAYEERPNVIVTLRACATANLPALVVVPLVVTTVIRPAEAPVGTTADNSVSVFTVNVADTPLKSTALAPVNPDPLRAIEVPGGPAWGENDPMVAAGGSGGGDVGGGDVGGGDVGELPENAATHALSASICTVACAPVPLHEPDQLTNIEPASGVAVSVTCVPFR